MGRHKFLINNKEVKVYEAEIVREGERGVDKTTITLPTSNEIRQNDDIIFMHDIVDLDDLDFNITFEDHIIDESLRNRGTSSTGIEYVNNKNNFGRAAKFNGVDSGVTIDAAENLGFFNEHALFFQGTFYPEPTIYQEEVDTDHLRIGADNTLDGDRVGIVIEERNIGIGQSLTKLSVKLSKNNNPTGVLLIGVLDINNNVKAEYNLNIAELTNTSTEYKIELDKLTMEAGDIIFAQYTGGTINDYVRVHGVISSVGGNFSVNRDTPWKLRQRFKPAWTFSDIGSRDETLVTVPTPLTILTYKLIYLKDGRLRLFIGLAGGGFTHVTRNSFADGKQHKVIVNTTRTPNGITEIFVDGVSEYSFGNNQILRESTSFDYVRIGYDDDDARYSNVCANVRFYKKSLTSKEIDMLSKRTIPIHTKWFGGKVWKLKKPTKSIEVECRSYGKVIGEIEVRGVVFDDATPESIVKQIINDNTDLNYVDKGIESSITLKQYVADGKLLSVITDMARLTNKVWRVDALKNFYFEESSSNAIPVTYTHGKNARMFESTVDDSELVNDLIVLGEIKKYTATERYSFINNRPITLENVPNKVSVMVGSRVLESEREYAVDAANKRIDISASLASGTSVTIEYDYEKPLYIRQTRPKSIERYGQRAKRLTLPWIRTYNDGVRFVSSYLNVFSKVKRSIKVQVPTFEHRLRENDIVRIKNSVKKIDREVVVKSETWLYPELITELQVGEFGFNEFEAKKQILEKIHDLESAKSDVKEINEYESGEEVVPIQDIFEVGTVAEYFERIEMTIAFRTNENIEPAFYWRSTYGGGINEEVLTTYSTESY